VSINQRIKSLENFYKKNKKELLYASAGIPQSTFASMKAEGKDIRYSNLMKILNCNPLINPMWLILGEGDMFVPKKPKTVPLEQKLDGLMDEMQTKLKAQSILAILDKIDSLLLELKGLLPLKKND